MVALHSATKPEGLHYPGCPGVARRRVCGCGVEEGNRTRLRQGPRLLPADRSWPSQLRQWPYPLEFKRSRWKLSRMALTPSRGVRELAHYGADHSRYTPPGRLLQPNGSVTGASGLEESRLWWTKLIVGDVRRQSHYGGDGLKWAIEAESTISNTLCGDR